ncbi:50S ribosomal protein L16 [archaeon]|jgi:large subunit ribosomal protein L10e|nr:50S ribosomal protein L16 [archaeon]
MATLRKANAYSKRKVIPFTRVSKKRQKSFIKVVPPQKIVKFEMGKVTQYKNGKLPHVLTVVSTEKIQLRHNAMEACRQYINKKIDKELSGQYFFKIVPFPHHIQREHRMLTGAGADRMSSGMQLSFGKSMGKAAILKKEGKLFVIALPNDRSVTFTRKVIKQVNSKLPGKIRVDYEKLEGKPKQ